MAASATASHRRLATGPWLPATQTPVARMQKMAKLDRAPATSITHSASTRSAPRRRSCSKAKAAAQTAPPGSVTASELPARVISKSAPKPSRTPPACSSHRWRRAKTTSDASSKAMATTSQPQRIWVSRAAPRSSCLVCVLAATTAATRTTTARSLRTHLAHVRRRVRPGSPGDGSAGPSGRWGLMVGHAPRARRRSCATDVTEPACRDPSTSRSPRQGAVDRPRPKGIRSHLAAHPISTLAEPARRAPRGPRGHPSAARRNSVIL